MLIAAYFIWEFRVAKFFKNEPKKRATIFVIANFLLNRNSKELKRKQEIAKINCLCVAEIASCSLPRYIYTIIICKETNSLPNKFHLKTFFLILLFATHNMALSLKHEPHLHRISHAIDNFTS